MFEKPKQMPSRDLNQLHPAIKIRAEKLLEACQKQGLPIVITQTYRTAEYQHKLYSQGRFGALKNKPIVTKCDSGTSPHEFRIAFDFCINIKGKAWDKNLMRKVGYIGKTLGLTWGGDWKSFPDFPHFEYTGKYTHAQIRAGKIPT
jgi:peptidoglycan L-alanyl-D-glutamate endopeptidase CwlK